jgi:hypothetical protein
MDKYEALLDKMRNSNEVPEWVLDEIATTYEASGLRTDLKSVKEKYAEAMKENTTLRTGLLADHFKSLGISISPSILNIPSDLPVTDPEKVQSWAEEMGLIAKTETTAPETRAVHDRIATASNEGGNTSVPSALDLDPSTMSEKEFYKAVEAIEAARRT